MPFAKAGGYHSKTLAYSIWHVFRIEDIVLHTLILNNSQVLERGEQQKKIGAEIITINGSSFLCKELQPGYLDGITGVYASI